MIAGKFIDPTYCREPMQYQTMYICCVIITWYVLCVSRDCGQPMYIVYTAYSCFITASDVNVPVPPLPSYMKEAMREPPPSYDQCVNTVNPKLDSS